MFEITTKVEITDQMVADLVTTAFEGGSNYWIERVDYGFVPTVELESPKYADPAFYQHGGELLIVDNDERKVWTLTRSAVAKGLQLMAEFKPRRHWQAVLDDNGDAETADVFLQLCLFGEVVFG